MLYNKRSHCGLNNYKRHTFESHIAQVNNVKSNFLVYVVCVETKKMGLASHFDIKIYANLLTLYIVESICDNISSNRDVKLGESNNFLPLLHTCFSFLRKSIVSNPLSKIFS